MLSRRPTIVVVGLRGCVDLTPQILQSHLLCFDVLWGLPILSRLDRNLYSNLIGQVERFQRPQNPVFEDRVDVLAHAAIVPWVFGVERQKYISFKSFALSGNRSTLLV